VGFISTADKRYDLDFKTPNNSGAEIKSGEEMIELYKSFCQGIATLAYNYHSYDALWCQCDTPEQIRLHFYTWKVVSIMQSIL
jgi:hypothetical protein